MKKFLIIGNMNAITYKEVFPHFKKGMVLGYKNPNTDMCFKVPSYYEERSTRFWIDEKGQKWRSLGNACWFTNLFKSPLNQLSLTKQYNPSDYPKYDNYNAINVDKLKDIPIDYDGTMGVPITILQYLNSDGTIDGQFEVEGIANSARYIGKECYTIIKGKKIYNRILIKKKFKIVGEMASTAIDEFNYGYPYINHKKKFSRILIAPMD